MKTLFIWIIVLVFGFAIYKSFELGKKHDEPTPVSVAAPPQDQVLEHFELEGFDAAGDQAWHLVGESAHIGDNKDVFIEKNVVLTINKITKVYADKVMWQNEKSRFLTNQPVKVVHEEAVIHGVGATGRLEDKFIQLDHDIKMELGPGTKVTAKGPLRVFQDQNKLVLYRDVWILDSRGAVSSNRMDAFFDPKTRKINQVIATDHVRISRGEDVSFANKAIYDAVTGSVKLEGAPEIEIADTTHAREKYKDVEKL